MYLQKEHTPGTVTGLEEAIQRTQAARDGGSPTGVPKVPPKAVPWLLGLVGVALVSARAFPVGHPIQVAADAVTDVAVLFGLASPGWRRK